MYKLTAVNYSAVKKLILLKLIEKMFHRCAAWDVVLDSKYLLTYRR
jgi:hypothetical protein